jgi:BirA family transcriptional regulator, biotin operon repressor / biotin---[acetyl-CoA-carboxylase] ligase
VTAPHGAPDIRVYDTLGSTNDEALRLAREGESGPLWVLAREQTAGRGRRGRSWVGAPGNLFITGLFTLPMPPHEAAGVSFIAALALAETLDRWVEPARIRLKWPNDVELDGTKCSGILIESHAVSAGVTGVAVGIGVNLLTVPEVDGRDVAAVAGALNSGLTAGDIGPERVASVLADRFMQRLAQWQAGGFAAVRTDWLARARGIGAPVDVNLPDRTLHGEFLTVSQDGAFRLKLADGTISDIYAGDVFFGST